MPQVKWQRSKHSLPPGLCPSSYNGWKPSVFCFFSLCACHCEIAGWTVSLHLHGWTDFGLCRVCSHPRSLITPFRCQLTQHLFQPHCTPVQVLQLQLQNEMYRHSTSCLCHSHSSAGWSKGATEVERAGCVNGAKETLNTYRNPSMCLFNYILKL